MAVYLRRQAIIDPDALIGKFSKGQTSCKKHKKTIVTRETIKPLKKTLTVDRVNIVVMGAAKVGKTCLVNRFLYGIFNTNYKETVEDMYTGQCNAHGMRWILEILDTSGAFSFPAMKKLAIDSGRVFILVYSVIDEESFEEVRRVREQILAQRADKPAPIVVVGNKCDLDESQRFLPVQTVDFIVNIEWGHYYFETSAKNNINVEKAFKEVLQDLMVKDNNSGSGLISVAGGLEECDPEIDFQCCGLICYK